jgi:hypothetical protein
VTDQKKAAIFTELSLMLAIVFWGASYVATKYVAEVVGGIPDLLH